jgi:pantoate--beta-alanine ligase
MRTLRTVAELRSALADPRRRGRTIGLVPTMGALHEGHLSLLRRAREECDEVVMSLFVNPSQFNERSDLEAYPRDERRDAALAAEEGVDFLFAPPVAEMYPDGFATTVSVDGLATILEGAHRGPSHFDAVSTVVTKLLHLVAPEVAYFGQKDAQQALVIRQLVRDLNLSVRIEVCPTVREPDGLAMSSRNALLTPSQRQTATALHRVLSAAREAVSAGERDPEAIKSRAIAELTAAGVDPEYFELVSPTSLTPVPEIDGEVLAVVAGRVGTVRLIDNETISPVTAGARHGARPPGAPVPAYRRL